MDFQEHYHVDLSQPGLLDRRSGRWLRMRIVGLMGMEGSRLRRALAATPGGES